jgi:predicted negative regulator of RcsB-dependent stress response
MNDQSRVPEQDPKPVAGPAAVPAKLPIELLPVYDWWQANGNRMLMILASIVIVGSATFITLRYRSAKMTEAVLAATGARSIEELEEVVNRYAKTPAGIGARLRLAKAYYDAERYEDALEAYGQFASRHGAHLFADIAIVGRAQALEALDRLPEALEIFRAFRTAHPDHYLTPTAWLGEARCLAMQGQKPEALALLDELRVAKANTPWDPLAKDLQTGIERFDGRLIKPASLFDQAGLTSEFTIPVPGEEPAVPTEEPTVPSTAVIGQ